jgi:hypothetical protein
MGQGDAEKVMFSDRYVHPEFGCLAPTSRFRRDLRIGLTCMTIGLVLGVVALVALTADRRHPEDTSRSYSPSAAALVGEARTGRAMQNGDFLENAAAEGVLLEGVAIPKEINTNGVSGHDADKIGSRNTSKPTNSSKPTAKRLSNAPPIARLPIGRSDGLPGSSRSGAARDATPVEEREGMLQRGQTATGRSSTTPPPRKRAEKTARRKNSAPELYRSHEESGDDRTDRDVARASRAYARETAPIPRGFWAWTW